ncbi:hypothetical protein ACFXO2_00940 [Streptomyces sp. NPDC059152]|uniref:hypothetical protein n=1 Tax=Streptomyces sp. NPDC059152 TaxID=3346742 RepID=UPI0036B0DFA0
MGFESDHGCDLLSVHGVQDADDHDLGHGGVLAQNLLDLAGLHVVPTADGRVLLAVDYVVAGPSSVRPRSPVWNQPSRTASAVVSGGSSSPP